MNKAFVHTLVGKLGTAASAASGTDAGAAMQQLQRAIKGAPLEKVVAEVRAGLDNPALQPVIQQALEQHGLSLADL